MMCLSACTRTGRGANVPDAERQSDSEYDVARDLFLNRHDPRGALEHAQKAVELNDQNAEANHFVALIYLSFCSTSSLDCRLPDAERAARRAVQIKADFRDAQNTLGVILIQEKKYDEAVTTLKAARGQHSLPVALGRMGQPRPRLPRAGKGRRRHRLSSPEHRGRAAVLCRQLSSRARLRKEGRSRRGSRSFVPRCRDQHPRMSALAGCFRSTRACLLQGQELRLWPRGTWKSARKSRLNHRLANVVRPA